MTHIEDDLEECITEVEETYADFMRGAHYIANGISYSNMVNAFKAFAEGIVDIKKAVKECEKEITDFTLLVEELENLEKTFTSVWGIITDAKRIIFHFKGFENDITEIIHTIH